MKNVLFVISGPSGVGKGTIVKRILEDNRKVALSVSCTTRPPREGEVDGKDYFFISEEEFRKKINEDAFLEYSIHFDNYYGTPKQFVLDKLKTNDVILEIDVNGGLEIKKKFPEAVLIFISPPSKKELLKRLEKRNTEEEELMFHRLDRADYEMSREKFYDYSVINDNLGIAVVDVESIFKIEKNKC